MFCSGPETERSIILLPQRKCILVLACLSRTALHILLECFAQRIIILLVLKAAGSTAAGSGGLHFCQNNLLETKIICDGEKSDDCVQFVAMFWAEYIPDSGSEPRWYPSCLQPRFLNPMDPPLDIFREVQLCAAPAAPKTTPKAEGQTCGSIFKWTTLG
jgi:hypothetical protein